MEQATSLHMIPFKTVCVQYLKLYQVVVGEGSSVRCHRNIAVEFCQPPLTDLSTVFPQVFLTQVKLEYNNPGSGFTLRSY